jgi:hypothetical protein
MAGYCAVNESLANRANQNICRWPAGATLRWTVVASLPGWSVQSLAEVYRDALAMWSAVSAVKFEYTGNSSRANILIGARRIDGPAGVLAEAELPCGRITPSTQLRAWFDISERWVVAANPPPGSVDFLRVAGHEFGHNLGIGHNSDGIINALMDPTVSHIRSLQNWDIAQAVMRYGSVAPPPAAPSPGKPKPDRTAADRIAAALEAFAEAIRRGGPLADLINGRLG